MTSDDPNKEAIAAELAALHRQAREAYIGRDAAGYMSVFAPDLVYRQPDGKIIGLEQLTRDVERQLRLVRSSQMSYVSESLDVDGDEAVEIITQSASIIVTAFFFLHQTWNLHRRGRYVWYQRPEGWRIRAVEVLEERVSRGGLRSALKP